MGTALTLAVVVKGLIVVLFADTLPTGRKVRPVAGRLFDRYCQAVERLGLA